MGDSDKHGRLGLMQVAAAAAARRVSQKRRSACAATRLRIQTAGGRPGRHVDAYRARSAQRPVAAKASPGPSPTAPLILGPLRVTRPVLTLSESRSRSDPIRVALRHGVRALSRHAEPRRRRRGSSAAAASAAGEGRQPPPRAPQLPVPPASSAARTAASARTDGSDRRVKPVRSN